VGEIIIMEEYNQKSKPLVVSFDDMQEGNDRWTEFLKLRNEFPNFKVTFFVITGNCSEEFFKRI
jgi:hypothetical protein